MDQGEEAPIPSVPNYFCPLCHHLAEFVISQSQAFCGNDHCKAICWDPMDDPANFLHVATTISLPPDGMGIR